ncbi:carbohydrate ABC transporter permease [Nocardioides sp.]|uniref:carbohydrate ABC transporter permease n=1 Tax=Nocardioides sp. TaxID=35761 RepID=UPI0027266AB0|nr:sugar ABC transporter permease [Nocardioides sp.]MDO9456948.1 sugar ABC transporter permease [Nocardioides sp.]
MSTSIDSRTRPGKPGRHERDGESPQEPGGTPPPAPPGPHDAGGTSERANVARLLLGLVGLIAVVWFAANAFLAFAYHPEWFADSKLLIGVLALVIGVGGAYLMFFFLNMFVEGMPGRLSRGVIPYAFLLPGFGLMAVMLLYPAIQTINYSFANADSTEYVGLDNYREIFGDSEFRQAIFNNILWLLIVPAVVVFIGLIIAVLVDRLSAQGEKIAKSTIFLPMAISFVGASAIWTLVYAYDDPSESPTGLLNAIWRALGGSPQTWLQESGLRLNSILLMVILVWLQVGFAMILLSSAIKGVPEDTLEAARIDGASEFQIFTKVVVPQIKGTIITVFITVLILVLKVFDIVYVLTNGRNETQVVANLFFKQLFQSDNAGVASSIVVVLLLAVTPVLIYQVRHFRREEAGR